MKNSASIVSALGRSFGGQADREVKVIGPELIEDYLTIYFNAYPAYKDLSEEGVEKVRRKVLYSMEHDENVTFCGLFEDGRLIAQMKLLDFSMNAFGCMVRSAGLMALAVHPLHKKKGAALDLVRFFEKYAQTTESAVAMLLPFRIDFYREMGYGYGSKLEEYKLPTVSLPKRPSCGHIRLLGHSPAESEALLDCQKAFARRYHGMVVKFEDEIRDLFAANEQKRVGYFDGDEMQGYAIYDIVSESPGNYTLNSLDVKELVYLNPKALKTLLGFFREQADLAQTVTLRTGEEDFYHVLPSAQDVSGNYVDFGYLQTNVGAVGTMYKLVDPAAFVRATRSRSFPAVCSLPAVCNLPADGPAPASGSASNPADGSAPASVLTVAFDYYDELAHQDKLFNLRFRTDESARSSSWEPAGSRARADIRVKCRLADLSSLFMGSCRFSSLVRLGAIELSDPACEELLDRLFYCRQKPWTNTDY